MARHQPNSGGGDGSAFNQSNGGTFSFVTSNGETVNLTFTSTYVGEVLDLSNNYTPQTRNYESQHLDFGYLQWRTAGPDGDDVRAARLGFRTPEAMIRAAAVDPTRRDIDDILLDWIPGRVDGSAQIRETEGEYMLLTAHDHLRRVHHRHVLHRFRRFDFAHHPFTWAGSDPYWMSRKDANTEYLHRTRACTREDNGSTTAQEIEQSLGWRGRRLLGPTQQNQPSAELLRQSQRRVPPGGLFQYRIPRRHGWRQGPDGELERDPEDMTSFHPGQAHLGWNHLPESMYTWAPRPQDGPGDDNENPPQKQDADGRPMFGKEQADAENEPTFCPLEDWWFLPESISTAVEGWELENWMRLGRGRLEYDQIRLRMNLRRVRPTPNTAQMRALRSREENSQACWWNKTGKSDPKSDTILRAMSKGDAAVAQGIVTRNSTRGFAPGLINPSQPRGPGNWIEFPAIAEYQHKKKELSHVRVLKEKEKGSDERFVNGTPATTGRKTRSGKSFNDHDTKASRDAHGKTTKEVRGTKKTKMDDNHVDSNGQGNPQPNGIQIPADWGRRRQELKRIKNPNNFQYDDSDSSEDDGEYGRPGVENRPLSLYSYRRRSSKRHLHLARLEERYRIRQNWATGNGLGFQEVIHGLDSLGNGPLLSSETVHSLMTPSREESVNMSSQEPPKPTRTRTLTDRGEELSFHSSRLLTLLGGTNQGTRKRLGNELNDEASIGVERPSHKKMKTTGHFSSSHPPRTETDLDALMELHTQQAKEASLNELQSKQASKSAQAIAQQPNNGFSLTAATPTGGPTASASYSSTIAATTGRSSQQHQQMLPPGLNPLLQGLAQAGASSSNRANSESAAERAIREQIAEEDRRERQEVEEVTKAMKAAWSKNRKKKPEGQ